MENEPVGISPDLPETADERFALTAVSSCFNSFFVPEIERRKSQGLLPEPFSLYAAQAIFPESGANTIRLNQEVRGNAITRVQRDVMQEEQLFVSDLDGLQSFDLLDEELNCGHITIFRSGPGWWMTFNALVGRKKAANFVASAQAFLDAARYSQSRSNVGPCIDNLFSCCELLAKAELIMHRSEALKSKKHQGISNAINKWAKLGNVSPRFVSVLNRMSDLRHRARYDCSAQTDHMPTDADFAAVHDYAERLSSVMETISLDGDSMLQTDPRHHIRS